MELLQRMGFSSRWREWIAMLLSSASSSILMNGEPGENFWHHQGLRQGDPFSPLLFIIAIDPLHRLLAAATERGTLARLPGRGTSMRVCLYADDAVIFANPSKLEVEALLGLLANFGEATGLRCNFLKSSISTIRCQEEDIQQLLALAGCKFQALPITYLGLPLSLRALTRSELQSLIDQIAAQLPTWKAGLLRRSGRLTLINCRLSAMPIFHLMALDLPPWFFKCIDKLRRGFFWRGVEDAKGGCCLIAWHIVCSPKLYGGLGVLNLRLLNQALRLLWLWLQKTVLDKPWGGLSVAVSTEAARLGTAALRCDLGEHELLV